MHKLLSQISKCKECEAFLPLGARPVVRASSSSKIAIIGQAPGIRVHQSGIPWNDPSGKNLREWLGVNHESFYDTAIFALVPMAFCYPGSGERGDLPPSKICAPLWHERIWKQMPNLELCLLVGQYAQAYYLGKERKKNLTATVRSYQDYLPLYFPLPHPSPRNNMWQARNSWFSRDVLPFLREKIRLTRGL